MSRFLRASSPQWIAASIFLPSPRTLAGVAKRRPDGASSSFRSGKPALSSCSKSAMTRYSFWQHEHSGKRTTARLACLGGALSDLPIELLLVCCRRRLDFRCRPIAASRERPVSGRSDRRLDCQPNGNYRPVGRSAARSSASLECQQHQRQCRAGMQQDMRRVRHKTVAHRQERVGAAEHGAIARGARRVPSH